MIGRIPGKLFLYDFDFFVQVQAGSAQAPFGKPVLQLNRNACPKTGMYFLVGHASPEGSVCLLRDRPGSAVDDFAAIGMQGLTGDVGGWISQRRPNSFTIAAVSRAKA